MREMYQPQGWEYRLWSLDDFPDTDAVRVAKSVPAAAGTVDILRALVLIEHGGWYFDADMYPIRSVEPLCDMHDNVVGQIGGKEYRVGNAAMGAAPGSAYQERCLSRLLDANREPWETPYIPFEAGIYTGELDRTVKVFPTKSFRAQRYWSRPGAAERAPEGVYCAHLYLGSWKNRG